jgi:hypothetical protein
VLQLEICLLIVVEFPAIPGIGVVAVITFFSKSLFMNIVLLMAREAFNGSFAVAGIAMTVFTGYGCM